MYPIEYFLSIPFENHDIVVTTQPEFHQKFELLSSPLHQKIATIAKILYQPTHIIGINSFITQKLSYVQKSYNLYSAFTNKDESWSLNRQKHKKWYWLYLATYLKSVSLPYVQPCILKTLKYIS